MRKWKVLALAVVFGTAACATADRVTEGVADGRIAAIDWTDSKLTLDTRDTFLVPARYELNRLETGERVAVSYITENGQKVATRIWTPFLFGP